MGGGIDNLRETIPAIGLKKGKVLLCDHNPQWEDIAKQTICILHDILGDSAIDIQHVGSTAVKNIQAKPVIDIIVGVRDFADVDKFSSTLEDNGFFFVGYEGKEGQPVYQCGEFDIVLKEMTFLTHYIHIVKFGGKQWNDYINMRDYLNNHPEEAKTYEKIKLESSRKNGESLRSYHSDKKMIVALLIERANEWKRKSMLIDNLFLVHYCHPNCKPFSEYYAITKRKSLFAGGKTGKRKS